MKQSSIKREKHAKKVKMHAITYSTQLTQYMPTTQDRPSDNVYSSYRTCYFLQIFETSQGHAVILVADGYTR